jgi:hypothetical protein
MEEMPALPRCLHAAIRSLPVDIEPVNKKGTCLEEMEDALLMRVCLLEQRFFSGAS